MVSSLDIPLISFQIFNGLLQITTGTFMERWALQAGKGHGLEVWRRMPYNLEYKGPQRAQELREQLTNCTWSGGGVEEVWSRLDKH